LKRSANGSATFEALEGERSRVIGSLEFSTVTRLLPQGTAAIGNGQAAVIDLSGVTGSDSSGLALLVEWLGVAKDARRSLRYENVPAQLQQLALLSEVDELLIAGAEPSTAPPAGAGPTTLTAGAEAATAAGAAQASGAAGAPTAARAPRSI
jgi:phospholipid transport system transporter-binding protein